MTRVYRRANPAFVGRKPHTSTIARTRSRLMDAMVSASTRAPRAMALARNDLLAAVLMRSFTRGIHVVRKMLAIVCESWLTRAFATSACCSAVSCPVANMLSASIAQCLSRWRSLPCSSWYSPKTGRLEIWMTG